MTDHSPRLFTTDAEIEHLGEGLLACTATREEWTHEAHLAATTYLLLCRPDIDLDVELPDIIRRFNESVGGVNSDTEGYHETITRCFLDGVRVFLKDTDGDAPLHDEREPVAAVADGSPRLAAALLQPRATVLRRGSTDARGARPREGVG